MTRTQTAHSFLLLLAVLGAVTFTGIDALLCAVAAVMAGAASVIHELRPRRPHGQM